MNAGTGLFLVPTATASDFAVCRTWIAHHSKSFYLSSLLLPRSVRGETWALYAFCRRADDAVDEPGAPGEKDDGLRRVATLRRRLGRVYEGRVGAQSDEAVDRAFAQVVARTRMPRALPEALLKGMEMDARDTAYLRFEDLLRYCFYVASTVGLMMNAVMGRFAPESRRAEVLLRAADLGVAMQLTNILRDVGEDGRRGRVYLPADLLLRHGTTQKEVLDLCQREQPPTPALRAALVELSALAQSFYASADAGIDFLPPPCRLAIRSARLIYAGILCRLARRGHDSITGRAFVPLLGKIWRVLRAFVHPIFSRPLLPATTLAGAPDALLLSLLKEVEVVP